MSKKEFNPVVYSAEFETTNGTLRIVINVNRLISDIQNYTMKLLQARDIPMNLESLPPNDKVVQFITNNMPWVPADRVMRTAEAHYEGLMREVDGNAGLIALTLTSDVTLWNVDPEPYDEPKNDPYAIEGDREIPEPEKNLLHPTERRLKQILDAMVSNPKSFIDMQDAINTALILVQRGVGAETDDDGFQPRVASKPVRRKAVSDSVEPEA